MGDFDKFKTSLNLHLTVKYEGHLLPGIQVEFWLYLSAGSKSESFYFQNNVLHYLNNGSATFCFMHWKEQFFVPVIMILKGLLSVSDQFIYKELITGREENSFYKGWVEPV